MCIRDSPDGGDVAGAAHGPRTEGLPARYREEIQREKIQGSRPVTDLEHLDHCRPRHQHDPPGSDRLRVRQHRAAGQRHGAVDQQQPPAGSESGQVGFHHGAHGQTVCGAARRAIPALSLIHI